MNPHRRHHLTRTVAQAGLKESTAHADAAALDERLYSNCHSVFHPPDGWPREVQYCNQLQWNEVPPEYQFLRMRISDESSVRRRKRLKIVKIKNKKHPCYGEAGLFAGEDIEVGTPLLDYAGKVSVVVGEESDTNRSSYLLNIFTDEEQVRRTWSIREACAPYEGGGAGAPSPDACCRMHA